jgi:uncharacterized protein YqkB
MNATTIRFGDYFTISMPKYKRLSELKRNEAVYLPAGLLANEIYEYINNRFCMCIPKELVNDILVVEMQRYDTMIDVSGNLFDWSDKQHIFDPMVVSAYSEEWFTKKISAVNNVFFDDVIDIEASVIYNLIEIRSKTKDISADYLRYYFWRIPFCINNAQCDVCEYNLGSKCAIEPPGTEALRRIRDAAYNYILENYGADSRFYIYCDVLENLEVQIDNTSSRDDLAEKHKKYIDEQSRALGILKLQELFGSPLYDNLKGIEAHVYSVLTPSEKKNSRAKYVGFVRVLEEALTIYNSIRESGKASGISQASIMAFKTPCEIILNAKLRLINPDNWSPSNTFDKNIKYVRSNKSAVLARYLTTNELSEFFDSLDYIRRMKNDGSHTTEYISFDEADKIIDCACNRVIRGIVEYLR